MFFFYEKRIVYRDLKFFNILVRCVKVKEVGVEYFYVKVVDFGLLRIKENSMMVFI